jgi:hypothetical protein
MVFNIYGAFPTELYTCSNIHTNIKYHSQAMYSDMCMHLDVGNNTWITKYTGICNIHCGGITYITIAFNK